MTGLEVRIADLPPMRVASALGFGTDPERQATEAIDAFAASLGIRPASEGHRLFGFNNPDPSVGSENYGYELWLEVGPNVAAAESVTIKQVPAARYAVTRFRGLSNIGAVWKQFATWYEDSPYSSSPAPRVEQRWLESLLNPEEPDAERWIFDLYLAIAEASPTD